MPYTVNRYNIIFESSHDWSEEVNTGVREELFVYEFIFMMHYKKKITTDEAREALRFISIEYQR